MAKTRLEMAAFTIRFPLSSGPERAAAPLHRLSNKRKTLARAAHRATRRGRTRACNRGARRGQTGPGEARGDPASGLRAAWRAPKNLPEVRVPSWRRCLKEIPAGGRWMKSFGAPCVGSKGKGGAQGGAPRGDAWEIAPMQHFWANVCTWGLILWMSTGLCLLAMGTVRPAPVTSTPAALPPALALGCSC